MKLQLTLFFFFLSFFSISAQDTSEQNLLDSANLYFERSEAVVQNYDSCIYYTQLAQVYYKKAQAWDGYVDCYNGLSTVYYWKRDFEKYKQNADSALSVAIRYLDKNSRPYAYAINNMGVLYNRKGDYNHAIELYKNSLSMQQNTGKADRYIARTYKNLGKVYQHKHDYLEALKYYNKSIAVRRISGSTKYSSFANDLLELAKCYAALNQPDSALHFSHESLNVLQEVNKKAQYLYKQVSISANHNIARLLLARQEKEQALIHINRAFSYQREANGYNQQTSYQLLAKYFLTKGQPKKALDNHFKVLELPQLNDPTSPNHKAISLAYQLIAETYLDMEVPLKALKNYQRALQNLAFDFQEDDPAQNPLIHNLNFKPEILKVLTGKAKTLMQLHKDNPDNNTYLKQAYDCYQLSKQLIRYMRQDFLATGSKHILAAKASPIYEAAIDNAVQLYHQTGEAFYLEDAFNSAENNKAILLLESMTEDLAKKSAGIPDHLREQEYNLTIDLAFYEKTLKLEKQKGKEANTEKIKNWEALLFDLQRSHQELISQLEKDFPLYYELKYTDATVSVQEIQQQLAPDALMLEYFIGEEQSYLFRITATQLSVVPLNLSADDLEAIDQIRRLISQPPDYEQAEDDFQAFLKHGYALYLRLLAPALSEIASPKQLVIIPDQLLSYLPFELLLSEPDRSEKIDYRASERSYLFKNRAISYDYSASLWRNNMRPKAAAQDLQAFAGFAPSFNESLASNDRVCTEDQLYSLKCSQQEVEAIQQSLGGDLFLGLQASKVSFQNLASNYQILHLATHACIDEQNPMLNKIHFTDDYLSNYDLSTLNINAELTVLSACNTGTGKLLKGEGVMSLARNFTQAGCQSTVMSLWSVNDCSTSKIMTHFYTHLAAGQNKNEALRNAKLDYLETANKMERSPYYWAAFVQFGNHDSMTFKSPFPFKTIILIGIGMLFLFLLLRLKKQ